MSAHPARFYPTVDYSKLHEKSLEEQSRLFRQRMNINTESVNYEDISISPQLARHLLDNLNLNTRPYTDSTAKDYAEVMEAGGWTESENCITLSPQGKLLNGRHRLEGVAKINRPITFAFKFACPEAAFINMDSGKKRSGADALSILHVPNYTSASTVVRYLLGVGTGMLNKTKVSSANIADYYFNHADKQRIQDIIRMLNRVSDALPKDDTKFVADILGGALYRCAKNHTLHDMQVFLNDIMNKNNGAYITRCRQIAKLARNVSRDNKLAIFILAWNKWVETNGKHVFAKDLEWDGKIVFPLHEQV